MSDITFSFFGHFAEVRVGDSDPILLKHDGDSHTIKAAHMNEQRAAEILGEAIQPDNSLAYWGTGKIRGDFGWPGQKLGIQEPGNFTAEELEAIAWWMRNKVVKQPPVEPPAEGRSLSLNVSDKFVIGER